MSGTDHAHPTYGSCECGHLDFMHPWTVGMRVDYQGECTGQVPGLHDQWAPCECSQFHADRWTRKGQG